MPNRILQLKPVKKTYEVAYWSCGIDGKGHRHKTSGYAQKCIDKQCFGGSTFVVNRKERRRNIVERWISLGDYAKTARDFDVSTTMVRDAVRDYVRAATWMVHYPHIEEYRSNTISFDRCYAAKLYSAAEKHMGDNLEREWWWPSGKAPDCVTWTWGLNSMQRNTLLAHGFESFSDVKQAIKTGEINEVRGLGSVGVHLVESWVKLNS